MEKNRTLIIIAIATFVLGLIIGHGTGGTKKEQKRDPRQLLNEAITGIDQLEKEKKNLEIDLKQASKSRFAKENQSLREKLNKAQEENKELQSQLGKLKGQLAHKEVQLESKEDLRSTIDSQNARLHSLEKENQELRKVIDKIRSISGSQKAGTSNQPSGAK